MAMIPWRFLFRYGMAAWLAALVLNSQTAPQTPPAQPAVSRFYAPYIMIRPTLDLAQIADASGIKFFTQAFVLDGGGCQASWGGRTPLAEETSLGPAIANLRARGGDVIVSFGGAGGRELAIEIGRAHV